ncbi:MAG TPA: hypothetical protein VH593_09630 [Ktedonobacteraceae bacterium]
MRWSRHDRHQRDSHDGQERQERQPAFERQPQERMGHRQGSRLGRPAGQCEAREQPWSDSAASADRRQWKRLVTAERRKSNKRRRQQRKRRHE